ncbi:MAG TPA: hypothetical protein QGH10_19695, partial [Armatimonadota bacterium]|nr:hypothetical protein [Armatimonadota bacterium]
AMIDEFASLMFGPASEPMREFYLALETSGGPDRYVSGNEFDLPGLFPPALRESCRALLDDAEDLADGDDTVLARIAFVELGWRYTELHLTAMEAHSAFRREATPVGKAAARDAWQAYVNGFDRLRGTHAFAERHLDGFLAKAQTQLDAYALDLAQLPPGDVSYQDQLNVGGNARLHGTVAGFYDGTWGLCLYKNGKGSLTYEFGGADGHAWSEARVAWSSTCVEGLTCSAELSTDGQTWEALAADKSLAYDDEFDLTDAVAGKQRFWVRLTYSSTLDREQAAIHAFKLSGKID